MLASKNNPVNRVIVIGGGPAGMLAAGTAAKYGAGVILLEKNNRLGTKLGFTGQGRCNLTNNEQDINSFISAYGKTGKFLYPALTTFSNQDTIQFFDSLGIPTKTESDGRVFPKSEKAVKVIDALYRYLTRNKVYIEYHTRVIEIVVKNNRVVGVIVEADREFQADAVILCTGGKSYPQTGSTGDGYKLVEQLGIKVNPLYPALVPLELAESWVKQLQGVALHNINLAIIDANRNAIGFTGDLIFTHYGISGPIALDSSEQIGKLLRNKERVSISLDLLPQFTLKQLDAYLQDYFRDHASQQVQNMFVDFLPKRIVTVLLHLAEIKPDKHINQLTKSERLLFIKTIKNLKMTVKQLRGLEEAMVTCGGIAIDEINPKTMESNRIRGLYFAGEVIDITGKSGGYNLQAAFSTGYIAGLSSAKSIG